MKVMQTVLRKTVVYKYIFVKLNKKICYNLYFYALHACKSIHDEYLITSIRRIVIIITDVLLCCGFVTNQ